MFPIGLNSLALRTFVIMLALVVLELPAVKAIERSAQATHTSVAQTAQNRLTGRLTYNADVTVHSFQLPMGTPQLVIATENFGRAANGEIIYSVNSPGTRGSHLTLLSVDSRTEVDVERNPSFTYRTNLELSDDGKLIAYNITAEQTKILERSGKVVATLGARYKPMQWLKFSFPNNLVVLDTQNPRNVILIMPPKYNQGITFTLPRGPIKAARFSPNMTQLVYELEDRIWVAKVDTPKFSLSAFRQLTHKSSSNPAWSPDGQWIVYLADDPNRNCLDCLHIMSAAGGEEFILVDRSGRALSALRNAHFFWHKN